jgi:hypothetical protein
VRLIERKLGHWECALEGDVGIPTPPCLSLLLSYHEVNKFPLPLTPTKMYCMATESRDHGLQSQKSSYNSFSRVFCHDNRKLTNTLLTPWSIDFKIQVIQNVWDQKCLRFQSFPDLGIFA